MTDASSDSDTSFAESDDEYEEATTNAEVRSRPRIILFHQGDGTSTNEEMTRQVNFDTTLPTEHSYLGTDMQYLRGRTLFEEHQTLLLPIMISESIVCPGYTLPLTVEYTSYKDMIRDCIQKDRTFGLVYFSQDEGPLYGVTMEIYEYDEIPPRLKIKAKGRQRFQIVDENRFFRSRIGTVKVRILPEIVLNSPLKCTQIESLNRCRLNMIDYDAFKHNEKYRNYDAMLTRWPLWVYNFHEEMFLVNEIKKLLVNFVEILPSDPVKLSYWIVQNCLFSSSERIDALKLNSSVQRLQTELAFLKKPRLLNCANCSEHFAKQSDLFPMSKDGMQANYCNPGGHLHETITVLKANNITLIGDPDTAFSWFPGYAWTIAQCMLCNQHVGWQFSATKPNLNPHKFFGLTRSSITIKEEFPPTKYISLFW